VTAPAPSSETVEVIPASEPAAVAADGAPAGPPVEAEVTPLPVYQPIVEPIPAPPAPLSRKAIRSGPWRGRWWMGLRVGVAGPLGGQAPARPSLGSISGGLDFGYRFNNWIGIGTGLSGHLHERVEVTEPTEYGPETRRLYGDMLFWDPLFARIFLPLKRRFQPFAEIGGGLAAHDRAEGGYILGGQLRSGVGFEGWLTPNLTLGLIGNYRYTRLNQKFSDGTVAHPVGHSYQAMAELGFHW